jgi:HlyD family secretion protein
MKVRYFIVFLLLLSAMYGGYRFFHREKPVDVTVVIVDRGLVESTVANTRAGTVKVRHRARLAPAIGGQIATLDVHKGDPVKKNQILLSLWNNDIRAQLQLSRQEMAAVEVFARKSCLEADFAGRESRRLTELLNKKSTSEALYDKALTTAATSRAACEAARIQVSVSRDKVNTVQALLKKTILRAPFSGIVAEINGEIGEFITPSPTGVATLPAVDLINLENFYVTAPIDEMDAAKIRKDMSVRISLDAFPGRQFAGTVLRIAPYVLLNRQNRPGQLKWNAVLIPQTNLIISCLDTAPMLRSSLIGVKIQFASLPSRFSKMAACMWWRKKRAVFENKRLKPGWPTGNLLRLYPDLHPATGLLARWPVRLWPTGFWSG